MFWHFFFFFFPFVLSYFPPTHNAHLCPWSFSAINGILRAPAWATAEHLMDPVGHLGLPHSSKDSFWIFSPSSDLGQLWCLQMSSCVWTGWMVLQSSRFNMRPREQCQHHRVISSSTLCTEDFHLRREIASPALCVQGLVQFLLEEASNCNSKLLS